MCFRIMGANTKLLQTRPIIKGCFTSINFYQTPLFPFNAGKDRKVEKKESPDSSINLTSSDEEDRQESRTPSKSPTPRRTVEKEETSETTRYILERHDIGDFLRTKPLTLRLTLKYSMRVMFESFFSS